MRRVNVSVNSFGNDDATPLTKKGSDDDGGGAIALAKLTELSCEGDDGEKAGQSRRAPHPTQFLRKFVFEWELNLHFSLCIASIFIPFAVSGSPFLAAIPLSLWSFYNALFIMGAKRASAVFPSFDRLKRNFVSSIEEFLPPRLLPVLSLSFLMVVVAVAVTAAKLGGPPLCLSSCGKCLSHWSAARSVPAVPGGSRAAAGAAEAAANAVSDLAAADHNYACGYANGKELLAFYTVSQSAILIYLAVMVGLLTCLAWKVSEEELAQRQGAESWLKGEDPVAYDLRERMMYEVGRPGSAVRPETSSAWLGFGLVAACTFTLIGWKKWGDLPATATSIIVIGVNVATIVVSVLLLHVGFYGRLVALYRGNLCRVQFLSRLLCESIGDPEGSGVVSARAWWSVRSFVLLEDLSLDYDIGGLGVTATLSIVLTSFIVAVIQIVREGLRAILSPPGSYCAYASVYLTVCLIRIFGLATETYREQQAHAAPLRERVSRIDALLAGWPSPPRAAQAIAAAAAAAPAAIGSVKGKGSGSTRTSVSPPHRPPPGSGSGGSGCGGSGGGGGCLDLGGAAAGVSAEVADAVSAAAVGKSLAAGAAAAGGGGTRELERLSLATLRSLLERMYVQIETADPYPCVLGIPVKPALFATAKVYVFLCFAVISAKLMYTIIAALL